MIKLHEYTKQGNLMDMEEENSLFIQSRTWSHAHDVIMVVWPFKVSRIKKGINSGHSSTRFNPTQIPVVLAYMARTCQTLWMPLARYISIHNKSRLAVQRWTDSVAWRYWGTRSGRYTFFSCQTQRYPSLYIYRSLSISQWHSFVAAARDYSLDNSLNLLTADLDFCIARLFSKREKLESSFGYQEKSCLHKPCKSRLTQVPVIADSMHRASTHWEQTCPSYCSCEWEGDQESSAEVRFRHNGDNSGGVWEQQIKVG